MLAVGAVAFAVGLLMLALQLIRVGGDVTAPFLVGSAWGLDDRLEAAGHRVTVVKGEGYDGQWFLGLAYNPLLRSEDLVGGFDMPRYRARRPLFPITGWVLAGGVDRLVPYTLLAVGPLAAGLGAAASGRLLAAYGRSRWWGLGFAVVPGVAVGVTFGTAEPLALALAALGLSLSVERRAASGAAFAAAGLTKENYAVFALVAAAVLVLGPGWRRVAGWRAAAMATLPVAVLVGAWSAYVAAVVPTTRGEAQALGAIAPPLTGWAEVTRRIVAGDWVADAPIGPLAPVLLLGSLVLAVAGIVTGLRRPGLAGWTAVVLGGYALFCSGVLLSHFMSSMRALAPCVFAAGLGLAAGVRSGRLPTGLAGERRDAVLASPAEAEPA